MGAYIWRGDLREGFLRYEFGVLMFEGAYRYAASLLAHVIFYLGWVHEKPLTANLTSWKFPATGSSLDTLLTYCYLGHYPSAGLT